MATAWRGRLVLAWCDAGEAGPDQVGSDAMRHGSARRVLVVEARQVRLGESGRYETV
jgi:hypothetical protein